MNSGHTGDFGAVGVWNAALLPKEVALRTEAKLAAHRADHFAAIKQRPMIVDFAHGPAYQRSVDDARPKSFISTRRALKHKPVMTIGQRIRQAHQRLGLSQAEAARRCGFSVQRFGNYVTDKRLPDLTALVTIARALETTPDELLGVSATGDQELSDILGRLLELEGLNPDAARTIAQAASATRQVLQSLPGDHEDHDRSRMAAQIVWSARRLPAPDKQSGQ